MRGKRGQTCDDGCGKKILSFFLGLEAFCTHGDIWVMAVGKKWAGYSSFYRFSAVDYQCWREKKIFCQCILRGGQKLSISSDSHKRAKRMVLNLQINQKHCPGNWKGVIKRQTFVHKYKGDSLTFPHRGTASWDKYAHNNDSRANWNLEMWVDKLHYMLI